MAGTDALFTLMHKQLELAQKATAPAAPSPPLAPIRAWLRQFDVDKKGVAPRKALESALAPVLGFSAEEMDMLLSLESFQSGKDNIDYDALLAFLLDSEDSETPPVSGYQQSALVQQSPPVQRQESPPVQRQESPPADPWFMDISEAQRSDIRSAELAWLRNLSGSLPDHLRNILVSHRGFHCTSDRTKRPIENTLPAYEHSWSSGILHCECDIQLTKDGYLVLNHDEDIVRLGMAAAVEVKKSRAAPSISNLTLKQVISSPTKSGVRQPLLKEVLDAALTLESAKLVIEVKAGGFNIAGAVVDFFKATPSYLKHVAVIMSFDPDVVFQVASTWPKDIKRPTVLLLTTKPHETITAEPYEQRLDFDKGDVREDVKRMINRNGVKLDGVYVEWTEKLLGKSASWLEKLCELCVVGMWQRKGDPDCLGACADLVRRGVSFVNTDFPRGFLREYIGKVQPEERLPESLFASIEYDDGSASGVWKKRPERDEMIKALQEKQFDIVIIGGGATGLGTALEATRQGYSVALVDRGDFACGTSSKSSNMIHGGIRYLQAFVKDPDNAQEQIDVVKKGLAEQTYMYNCAPYNVRPCPFMVACYAEDEKDTFGKLLKKYDELGSDDPFPESNWNSKRETLFRFPHLRQKGLIGSYIYYDGQQDDARMAILIALTAIEGGATICNYLNAQSLIKDNGVTRGVVLTDTDARDGKTFEVRAKVVVNATGPFTDAILKMDQGPQTPNIIKPAAGTHLVIPDHFSPDRTGLAILETSDGRAMFYLPWMGQTIVGTTDFLSEIKPLLSPPESDIKWIISEVNRYLNPDHTPATLKDVRAAWIGIRPLAQGLESATGTKDVKADDAKKGDTKSVPREHAVIVSDSKLVTITGGKWTSYRHMAQDTLTEAIQVGNLPPQKKAYQEGVVCFEQGFVGTKAGPNVEYVKLDLACAAPFHSDVVELRKQWRFSREIAENLVASYGTHAIEVACIARRGEERGFAQRLADGYPWIMAQVVYGIRREYARTVSDVLSRRTRLAQVDVLAAYDAVPKIVDVMAEELEWSQERIQAEVDDAKVFLESCGLTFCLQQGGMVS